MNQIIKKEVTLGQLLALGLTLLTMIGASWLNMSNRVQALEIKTQYRDAEVSTMIRKLDKIQEDISCIKVDLMKKADINRNKC